ncbi:hypothetical protein [Malaciobacter marinus]|nr:MULTISPECIES: hypothetical protein [Malaciobacter]
MREPWVAYVVVLSVVALMILGKKMIFFPKDEDESSKKDENDKS